MPLLKTQIQWFTRIQQTLMGSVLLMVIPFYLLAFGPQSAKLHKLNEQIGQKERELAASQAQARALPEVQADIDRLRAKLADFKKLPTNPGDLGQFEIEIAGLARRDKLRGWSVSWPGTPKRNDRFYELPVSLKFDGDFRDVFAFISQLEDLPRLTRVKSLTVRQVDADGNVQVELLMNLYYTQG